MRVDEAAYEEWDGEELLHDRTRVHGAARRHGSRRASAVFSERSYYNVGLSTSMIEDPFL